MAHPIDLQAAERFLWLNARLIDRLRFEFHFRGGPADAVMDALRPYRCAGGGFGHALEPDGRGPEGQPLPLWTALEIVDEIGLPHGPERRRIVDGALAWLVPHALADGGIPFSLPTAAPHAPWLRPEAEPRSSLLSTSLLAGVLHRLDASHPWLDRATAFCWGAIERLGASNPYEVRAALSFLDHAPDRARAERAFERIAAVVREQKLVTLDPHAHGEVHSPLDFAPSPKMLARKLFDDATIERHLDALAAAQQPDGGWLFDWLVWTPIVEPEWRGVMTVKRLCTLRDYGRLRA